MSKIQSTCADEKMPRVSVVIPTYKRSEKLGRAIDSALNQTFHELEVIVIDDNNPDTEYRRITEEFMRKYYEENRVRYIQHEKNKNGAAARNTGIRNSRGEFIALLDDDDFFYPSKIEKQVCFMDKHEEFAGVYCGRVQNGKAILVHKQGDLSKEILAQEFTPTTPSLLFRKEALMDIGGFDENFKRHQDYELLLKFFRKYKIGAIEEPLVEIGTNEGENQIHGKQLEEMKERFLKTFQKDIERIDQENKGYKDKVYISNYRSVFIDHLSRFNIKGMVRYYIKGCKISFSKFNHEIVRYIMYYVKYKFKK